MNPSRRTQSSGVLGPDGRPDFPSPYRLSAARLALVLLFLASTPMCFADDWPQILGPSRNGVAAGESLLPAWPPTGPKQLFAVDIGAGFAGPAVADGRVVVFHRQGGQERVQAHDATTGELLWKSDFPASYRGSINPDSGPRCVPVIHDGAVYVYGAAGDLHCLDAKTGTARWSRNLLDDYDGNEGYFGAGSTPLVAGDKLLVNVGGRKAGIVALDLRSGRTVWENTEEGASYSSPILASVGNRNVAVFVTRLNCVAVDPLNGKVVFSFPFGKRGPTVNAATPLFFDKSLFLSAAYGVGARLVRIDKPQPTVVWDSDEVMSSQYTTCVYRDGFLYGIDGREDFGNGRLRCFEASSGKVRWTQDDFGIAHVILAQDHLLILKVETGELILASASPDKYRALAQANVSEGTLRALPALANGRLYFRNNLGTDRGQLVCLLVGETETP